MTREQIEAALDSGKLRYAMPGARYPWSVRRNGATRLWKRTPDRFRIPIKIGFRSYGYIDQRNVGFDEWIIDS